MNKEINYPIKYAVLELKEKGGYPVGYKDITQGYIVSKCYVIESSILYSSDGSNKIIHKVVFPFQNIEEFKNSLKNNNNNIGKEEIPQYNAYSEIYPISIVNDLFDSYKLAKKAAEEKNNECKWNLISKNIIPTLSNIKEEQDELRKEFEKNLEICNKFEQLVLTATKNMEISKEKNTNKVRKLKI